MQIDPCSPSGSSSPVSGSTICTTNASSKMCSPSCAGHSTDTHCTSWKPYELKHSTPNVDSSSSRSPMLGSARELEVGGRVVAHLRGDVGEAQQVVAGGEDRRGAVLDGQLDLAFAARDVAGAGGEHHAVEPVVQRFVERERAVVRAVRPRVEDDVAGTDALHVERPRGEQRADLAVPLRVEGRARLAGGPARHEHPHRLVQRVGGSDALVVAPRRMRVDALPDVVDGVRRRRGRGRRASRSGAGRSRRRASARRRTAPSPRHRRAPGAAAAGCVRSPRRARATRCRSTRARAGTRRRARRSRPLPTVGGCRSRRSTQRPSGLGAGR